MYTTSLQAFGRSIMQIHTVETCNNYGTQKYAGERASARTFHFYNNIARLRSIDRILKCL